MSEILYNTLLFFLYCWFIVSPLVFIWWFFDPDTRDRFTEQHEKLAMGLYVGSFFSLICVLGRGIHELLGFIPANWGTYEDGEFLTFRITIASALALSLSIFISYVFFKFEEIRVQSHRLSVISEFRKQKDEARYGNLQFLVETRDEVQAKLENIYNRAINQRLTSKEKREVEVLSDLLEELEYRIREPEEWDSLAEA